MSVSLAIAIVALVASVVALIDSTRTARVVRQRRLDFERQRDEMLLEADRKTQRGWAEVGTVYSSPLLERYGLGEAPTVTIEGEGYATCTIPEGVIPICPV